MVSSDRRCRGGGDRITWNNGKFGSLATRWEHRRAYIILVAAVVCAIANRRDVHRERRRWKFQAGPPCVDTDVVSHLQDQSGGGCPV